MSGARSLALLVLATSALAGAGCSAPEPAGGPLPAAAGAFAAERGVGLGPDEAAIGELRVSVRTGVVNGAGTDNDVLVWFDNERHRISTRPARSFAPGQTATVTLRGTGLPRTLGELRRASIVLSLHLNRADIAASWYCDHASVEVRLEGEESFASYLEVEDVGWLSQDEPPRRSPAFALQ